jgi:uncharacterized protein (UPF0147 family)
MPETQRYDARAELVQALLQQVEEDQYPSVTMLDMLEELMTDEEIPAYAQALLTRVRSDRFPSIPMLQRLQKLT